MGRRQGSPARGSGSGASRALPRAAGPRPCPSLPIHKGSIGFHFISRPRVGCPETRGRGSSDCCLACPTRALPPSGRGRGAPFPTTASASLGRCGLMPHQGHPGQQPDGGGKGALDVMWELEVGTRPGPSWKWGPSQALALGHMLPALLCPQPTSVPTTASSMWSVWSPSLPPWRRPVLPGRGLLDLWAGWALCPGPGDSPPEKTKAGFI